MSRAVNGFVFHIEEYDFVSAAAPHPLAALAALHEDLQFLTDMAAVQFFSDALLKLFDRMEPHHLFPVRDVVRPGCGYCARSWRIGCYVHLVELHFFEKRQRVHKLLVRLAWEAHYDIGRERDARNSFAGAAYEVAIVAQGIPSLHALYNFVVACLHRYVDVLHCLRKARHSFYQVLRHILRVGGQEPDPPEVFDAVKALQERGKICRLFEVVAECINILAKQGDFAHSLRSQVFDLFGDIFYGARALLTPAEGHDAVGAGFVAAVYDRDI